MSFFKTTKEIVRNLSALPENLWESILYWPKQPYLSHRPHSPAKDKRYGSSELESSITGMHDMRYLPFPTLIAVCRYRFKNLWINCSSNWLIYKTMIYSRMVKSLLTYSNCQPRYNQVFTYNITLIYNISAVVIISLVWYIPSNDEDRHSFSKSENSQATAYRIPLDTCLWPWRSKSIIPQNNSGLHLWPKFGNPSFNGWWVSAQTSSRLTHRLSLSLSHTHTHTQMQAMIILKGQKWPPVNYFICYIRNAKNHVIQLCNPCH